MIVPSESFLVDEGPDQAQASREDGDAAPSEAAEPIFPIGFGAIPSEEAQLGPTEAGRFDADESPHQFVAERKEGRHQGEERECGTLQEVAAQDAIQDNGDESNSNEHKAEIEKSRHHTMNRDSNGRFAEASVFVGAGATGVDGGRELEISLFVQFDVGIRRIRGTRPSMPLSAGGRLSRTILKSLDRDHAADLTSLEKGSLDRVPVGPLGLWLCFFRGVVAGECYRARLNGQSSRARDRIGIRRRACRSQMETPAATHAAVGIGIVGGTTISTRHIVQRGSFNRLLGVKASC